MHQYLAQLLKSRVKIVSIIYQPFLWAYDPPLGITLRSGVATSLILKTHGRVFRERFSSASISSKTRLPRARSITSDDSILLLQANDLSFEPFLPDQCPYSPSECDNFGALFDHYFEFHLELVSSGSSPQCSLRRVDAESQTEPEDFHAVEHRRKLWPLIRTPTSNFGASPSTSFPGSLCSIDEHIERDIASTNIPPPVDRTHIQNSALTDLLEIVILPTYTEDKFESDERRIDFRSRIGQILKDYRPLTSAVFLAFFYMERLRYKIDGIHSFYWWFILCLLYAHQTLDDFNSITIWHISEFMNVDPSFAARRQRNGYKALQYDLFISQVDWVYLLNHLRLNLEPNLPLTSAEAILQLIFQSLPNPSFSSTDELRHPLQALEKALEEDRETVQRIQESLL
ncbi:hypothetical protein C8J55DRAFT_498998 [Lentinula edodes]|uniref:Uncharacterized protein n=1 Tax=Lentinula lateritia TaxID=40482 RepID=A0A9W9AYE3_9AGAR|nr:hypothetical protein C8J55DRAFT_498998 [Lentinula edodes]